jgi:hypothetical protein
VYIAEAPRLFRGLFHARCVEDIRQMWVEKLREASKEMGFKFNFLAFRDMKQ